ncbi:bifunctional uridylyltransferase/uridylyl-removing enzyme [Thiohalobacter sp. COW1]|uniref:[protein-PII] uridylyltransferase n=1 Tax=Thiohalobacter sp. COW1 TaxID=2795687 RepID=UPI001916BDED|nr:[protein-PII] uridylyltransferase [Thiohalobacter sp. COW1]BCO30469.1 bifunctional uridylyltransferase/uridylyl-removing enzyme [Thiohalobacter sp. COW1]
MIATPEPRIQFPDRPALPDILDTGALDAQLAGNARPMAVLREALKQGDATLRHHFEAGAPAPELVYGRCWLIDQLLRRAWALYFDPQATDISLVAVGGYGRAELLPGSDIDLLILLAEGAEPGHAEAIREFLADLWDMGVEVGHSVRTIAECVEHGRADITIATNLLEARHLTGSHALYEQMRERTGPEHMWNGRDFFDAKLREQDVRHHKYHDTAYNLEPNIKENPGGLRDIQMIGWVAKRHYGVLTLHGLVEHGFLTEHEYETLVEGQSFLWRIRFALHSLTRRREDRLLFDHQRTLAAQLGYQAADSPNLSVELFMKDYYRTVFELNRLNEMLLQLFKEQILYADDSADPVVINKRFQSRKGFIEVAHPNVFRRYPFALLEIFLVMAQHPNLKGVRASTIRLIRDHRHLIDEDFRNDLRSRALFMEIIRQPHGVTHELRRMNRYGILAAYLPVFGRIVGQMQYDLFHAFTVDEHTLFVVRNIRRLTVPEFAQELPFASELIRKIPKQELLILAALFHDIAKGRGGDHSELGADEARRFCQHHGLSRYDSELVAWLVQNHLLMSTTAQRRDISDPAVINEFAQAVGSRMRLNYLYLLTVADIRGTNQELWNSWKAALLSELYNVTSQALRRGLENPLDQAELVAVTRHRARDRLLEDGFDQDQLEPLWDNFTEEYFLRHSPDEIVWQTHAILDRDDPHAPLIALRPSPERGGTEIFVYMPTDPGLFERITAMLDQMGLDVMDARILTSEDHYALDSYVVLDDHGRAIEDPARIREIRQALIQGLGKPHGEATRVTRRPPRQFRHFDIRTLIEFKQDAPNQRTIMELITGDRPGLLSAVARAFTHCDVNIRNARIATFGARAEDVFYITDHDHRPIRDQAVLDSLREHIINELEQKTDQDPASGT